VVALETTGKDLLADKLDRKLFTIESFGEASGEVVPPRKVVVGVIATTGVFGKYRVYRVSDNNRLVSGKVKEMRECVAEVLEKVR
jgi:hypothetical protein